jgi:hypothetical protein
MIGTIFRHYLPRLLTAFRPGPRPEGNMATNDSVAKENAFRSSLEDCVPILERLGPLAASHDELIGMLKLGIENEAQLRLLLNYMTPNAKK